MQKKVKRPAAAGSQTQDTSGLSHRCSATEPQQLDNHQPSQSSICTQYGFFVDGKNFPVNPLSEFWQHIVSGCQVWDWGIQYHLCSTYRGCGGWWWPVVVAGCRGSVVEHWRLQPVVSWVRLSAAAGTFTFLYFRLITSKFLYFQCEPRCSEQVPVCVIGGPGYSYL